MTEMPDYTAIGPTTLINEEYEKADENIQKESDEVNVANKVDDAKYMLAPAQFVSDNNSLTNFYLPIPVKAPEASDEKKTDPAHPDPETTGLLLEQQRLLSIDF